MQRRLPAQRRIVTMVPPPKPELLMALAPSRLLFRHATALVMLMLMSGCASLSNNDDAYGHFVTRSVTLGGAIMPYQVFVPANAARPPGPLPVVLFLHGSGERGSDGQAQTTAGLGNWLRANADRFPALVVFPQAPDDEEWMGDNARMQAATPCRILRVFHRPAAALCNRLPRRSHC